MLSETRMVNLQELPALTNEVIALAHQLQNTGATIIALQGDLGAGKTTFVQSLGQSLGVSETITSPTFTIMKGYETTDDVFKHLIHMDAYRIDDLTELGPLRFADLLAQPQTLFCIEWAEKIVDALPKEVISLSFEVASENTRTVHISHN